jgi:Uma2 family endonuclease
MQPPVSKDPIVYPESDGKPMADNTLQFAWMVALFTNLRFLLRKETAFVAIDLFWYPVEGDPRRVTAPDVMVALGRPEGYRSSYKQWEEGNQPPQVVFEVLSPSNIAMEMMSKIAFFDRYRVEECLILDPEQATLKPYVREGGKLITPDFPPVRWQSPRLGISFAVEAGEIKAYLPDGSPFKTLEEESQRRAEAEAEVERLRARLRELGEE